MKILFLGRSPTFWKLTVIFNICRYSLQAKQGVPALLIYKDKEMIANFVRMTDEFGDDFYASDIESFLLE